MLQKVEEDGGEGGRQDAEEDDAEEVEFVPRQEDYRGGFYQGVHVVKG